MVSNLFLQLIHIELLLSYSVKEILTLVKRDPRFNVKLLNDLYFGDSVIDEETHRFIANNVVSWLYERGENPDEFIERIVKRCSDFEAIPSRCVLRTYLPYISSFYSCKDVRELCLEIIPKRYQFLKQAAVLRNEVVAENREMLFTYKFETPSALVSNPMRWIIGMFRVGPLLLGTPTYEHMNFLASQTSFIEAMENRLPVEMRDGDVYVNGEVVGKSTLFGECVKKCGIKWEDERELEIGCVLATKDVIDPKTKTVLAKEGCFYGAPANILDVKFKANISCVEPFIKLMNSVVKQEFEAWQPIQKAQEQLLDAMNDSVTIVYYKSDDSISVNSKHLMRNVPARILRNLLREYTATGREEYENREFKRDSAICMDPLRPNFESRLNRVIAHINGTDDKDGKENEGVKKYFEIERHRRGGFRFVPKCKIVFREE
ncbi:hypothetical protein [uncultured Fibrobacter sp.]|uniref:hypothetical protein n=1 Tax=uncultured Fibrobacter sp. TaxID=261512 RepID=UPI0025CEBCCB|nr:hypothetical protein [uncultured Fibrobacter sp.]